MAGYIFNIYIVLRDIPGLIGMDILSRHYKDTTWVITEKTDNMSKTGSKVKARLCTMGYSAKDFSKDSVQFESPTCGRDTVKAILSLVPDNKWNF